MRPLDDNDQMPSDRIAARSKFFVRNLSAISEEPLTEEIGTSRVRKFFAMCNNLRYLCIGSRTFVN